MLQKIGFLTICIGAMMADSTCLWIPAGVVLIGALLIHLGGRSNDETA